MRKVFPTILAATALSLIPLASANATPSSSPADYNDNWQIESCNQFYDLEATPTSTTTSTELEGTGVVVKHTQYKWEEETATYRCDALYLQGTPKAVQNYDELAYSTKLSGDVTVGDAFTGYVPGFVSFSGSEPAAAAYADLTAGYQYPLFTYIYTDEVSRELGPDKANLIGHPELVDNPYTFSPDNFSYKVSLAGAGDMATVVKVSDKQKAQATKTYNLAVKIIQIWADVQEAQINKSRIKPELKAKLIAQVRQQEAHQLAQALEVYNKLIADKVKIVNGPWTRAVEKSYGF